jgi:hypothetical protein
MHYALGQHDLAVAIARQGEESTRHEALRVRFRNNRMSSMMMGGYDVVEAKALFETNFKKYDEFGSEIDHLRFEYTYDFKVIRATNLNIACWYAGFPDLAVRYSEIGQKRARKIRHSMSLCCVLGFEFMVHEPRGDWEALKACATECFDIGTRENLAFWAPWASPFLGLVRAISGDLVGGLQLTDQALSWFDGVNFLWFRPYLLSLRSRMLDLSGRGEEAIATIDQAIAFALAGGEKVNLSELRRLRGEFLLRYRGGAEEHEAEKEFHEALAFAQKQKALSYELRAAHSLVHLMRSRGDDAGALALLTPVYNRFTEGFHTADLISARQTIDELRSAIRRTPRLVS